MTLTEAGTAFRRYVALAGAAATGIGVLLQSTPPSTPGREYWPHALAAGTVLLAAVGLWWWNTHVGSASRLRRWGRRRNRNEGVASTWRIWRECGRRTVRSKLRVLRPQLAALPWWQRLLLPSTEVATQLARAGVAWVRATWETVVLLVGGPRSGKTAQLINAILDAPGAAIVTSTRVDLLTHTGPRRRELGPVYVFNPSGVGAIESTIGFDPLLGCGDPKTARERASDLLSASSAPGSGGDHQFWKDQAIRVLAALMHAAALGADRAGDRGGESMHEVLVWVANPTAHAATISRLLRRSPVEAWEADIEQFLGTNDRTQTSICATIMPALGWLTDAVAARAVDPDRSLDVHRLLDDRGTVYMLGGEDGLTAPLVTALTAHIAREARRIAEENGGRLDPPLFLGLDEAAIICPIPLDKWTADMGGRGIAIHIAVQSRAQLRDRWGDTGAAAIINNAGVMALFPGIKDADDLRAYSTLCGERDEELSTHNADGKVTSKTVRRVPVMAEGAIAQLPNWHALIIHRGMPPTIGRIRPGWERRDLKAAVRREKRAALRAEEAARRRAVELLDLDIPALPTGNHSDTSRDGGGNGRGGEVERRRDDHPDT